MSNTEVSFHSLESLSPPDRLLFNQYSRGVRTSIPFDLAHNAFEHYADHQPRQVAIENPEGDTITYRELERRANILANRLIDSGLAPRQRVCIVVRRSIQMVVAILATLKAGCQYVLLDGGFVSDEMLTHVLKDTAASFVLCLGMYEDRVRKFVGQTTNLIMLDRECDDLFEWKADRPESFVRAEDGAYISYTSGTTGKPKGVDIRHIGMTNTLCLAPGNMGIRPGSKVAHLLNISFDMGAWEILGTLMNGGTLYIRGSDWHETLNQVDTIIATPSILAKFRKNKYPNIWNVAVGGEPCPKALADEWSVGANFYNVCGPTEVSILSTAHLHQSGGELSVGKPNPNINIYLLDEFEMPVPIGQPGTIWIGGMGVSGGYLNMPQLTAAWFKKDKFTNDGNRMFNTGDLGKWRDNGNLEHLGRLVDQVKRKGFKVELDNINAAIESFPFVTKACTLLIDDVLYGFYSAPNMVDEPALRKLVSTALPSYAVPDKWIFVRHVTLTANGKLDKQALREQVQIQLQSRPTLRHLPYSHDDVNGAQRKLAKDSGKNPIEVAIRELQTSRSSDALIGHRSLMTISKATTIVADDRPPSPKAKGISAIKQLRRKASLFFSDEPRLRVPSFRT